MSDSTVEATRERLLKFKGRFPDICLRSGLKYSWLSKFANGERGQRPSFELMTRLTTTLDELEAKAKAKPQEATARS